MTKLVERFIAETALRRSIPAVADRDFEIGDEVLMYLETSTENRLDRTSSRIKTQS